MGKTHSRLCFVYVLAARTGGAIDINSDIFRTDVDINLFSFR